MEDTHKKLKKAIEVQEKEIRQKWAKTCEEQERLSNIVVEQLAATYGVDTTYINKILQEIPTAGATTSIPVYAFALFKRFSGMFALYCLGADKTLEQAQLQWFNAIYTQRPSKTFIEEPPVMEIKTISQQCRKFTNERGRVFGVVFAICVNLAFKMLVEWADSLQASELGKLIWELNESQFRTRYQLQKTAMYDFKTTEAKVCELLNWNAHVTAEEYMALVKSLLPEDSIADNEALLMMIQENEDPPPADPPPVDPVLADPLWRFQRRRRQKPADSAPPPMLQQAPGPPPTGPPPRRRRRHRQTPREEAT